jgi:hypothetical protein
MNFKKWFLIIVVLGILGTILYAGINHNFPLLFGLVGGITLLTFIFRGGKKSGRKFRRRA